MFALLIALAAMPQGDLPASEILAENRLAIALWPDKQLGTIYKPYFDCYWNKLESQPDDRLTDLWAASKMFDEAQRSCASMRDTADSEADKYLSGRTAYDSPSVRADVLPRYRRQVGFKTIAVHYRNVGKADLFNNYLAKVGRAARD